MRRKSIIVMGLILIKKKYNARVHTTTVEQRKTEYIMSKKINAWPKHAWSSSHYTAYLLGLIPLHVTQDHF